VGHYKDLEIFTKMAQSKLFEEIDEHFEKIQVELNSLENLLQQSPHDIIQLEEFILELDQRPPGEERRKLIVKTQEYLQKYDQLEKLRQGLFGIKS
jgi:hypothetical protein